MLKGQQDKEQVHVGTAVAAQLLCRWIFTQKGVAYVVSNEHYNKIILGRLASVTTAESTIQTFPSDRKTFLQDKLKDKECKGFIPVTPEALEEIMEIANDIVAEGSGTVNIPYAKNRIKMKVYK